jgi:hypothetical protein
VHALEILAPLLLEFPAFTGQVTVLEAGQGRGTDAGTGVCGLWLTLGRLCGDITQEEEREDGQNHKAWN